MDKHMNNFKDSEIGLQTDRQSYIQKKMDRQIKDKFQTYRQNDLNTCRWIDSQIKRKLNRKTDREKEERANIFKYRYAVRNADKYIHTERLRYIQI